MPTFSFSLKPVNLCVSLSVPPQVRYNRKRLKGGKGVQDCLFALTSLYDVLLSVCKVSHATLLLRA